MERVRKTGTLERKEGSGRKITVRTETCVANAKAYMDENKDATLGDLVKDMGLKRTTARRVLKENLALKPLRKLTIQRVKSENKEKRLEMRQKWDEDIASGMLDLTKIYWAEEKMCRLDTRGGGNHNLVA